MRTRLPGKNLIMKHTPYGYDIVVGAAVINEEQAANNDNATYAAWTPKGSTTPIADYIYFYYPYEGFNYFSIYLQKYEYTTSAGTFYYSYGSINSVIIDDGDYVNFDIYLYY